MRLIGHAALALVLATSAATSALAQSFVFSTPVGAALRRRRRGTAIA